MQSSMSSSEKQEEQINKYIKNTNKQLKNLNLLNDNNNFNKGKVSKFESNLILPENGTDGNSTRSSNAENYNPLDQSSPISKQLLAGLDNVITSSPSLELNMVGQSLLHSKPLSTDLPTEDDSMSVTSPVGTDSTTRPTTVASAGDQGKNKSPTNLKYLANKDFNQKSPQQPSDRSSDNRNKKDQNLPQWFPDILKYQDWEEASTSIKQNDNNGGRELIPDTTNDPYLSFTSNTVILNSDVLNNKSNDAEYKRYLNSKFENNLKNVKLPPLTDSQMFVPDTFMHKARPKRPSQLTDIEDPQFQTQNRHNQSADSENPGSPLKLFGPNQDTFTRGKFTALLNHCATDGSGDMSGQESQLQNDESQQSMAQAQQEQQQQQSQQSQQHKTAQDFVHESNNLFDGLVGKLSSANLIKSSQTNKSDDDYTSESDKEDMVYHSSPFFSENRESPMLDDGDKLYNNLKSKLGPTINLIPRNNNENTNSMTFSSDSNDYTSMGELYQQTEGEYTSMNNLTDVTNENNYLREEEESPSTKLHKNNRKLDVPNSLDELQRNLNLGNSVIKRPTIDSSKGKVMVPKIKKNIEISSVNRYNNIPKIPDTQNPRNTKLNFISGDDYKDKVYDKKLKKYVLITEYNQASDSLPDADEEEEEENFSRSLTGTFTLDELSDMNNTSDRANGTDTQYHKSTGVSAKEVSFNLPNEHVVQPQEESNVEEDDKANMSTYGNISFSESKSSLAQLITDVSPFNSWDDITSIEFNAKNLTNLEGLNSFLPNLLELEATSNSLGYLKGVPLSIESMVLSSNMLGNLTDFVEFTNLKYLNLSNNEFENLSNFTKLRNLREVNLSSNSIKSLDGLERLTNLISLDLSNNKLRGAVDFNKYRLKKLEYLDLRENKLSRVDGMDCLSSLIVLNLNNNRLKAFEIRLTNEWKSIRRLLLNSNRLKSVDFSALVNLSDLKIDNNNELLKINGLNFNIEKISIKSNNNLQLQRDLWYLSTKSSSFKKLEISGSGLSLNYFHAHAHKFSNLSNMNLSAMNLTNLPSNFSEKFPLLCNLNLNFNKLNDLTGLKGMKFLRHLKILSNNITKFKDIVDFSSSFRHTLQTLDVRVNPINKGYHPFVFYNDETANNDEENTTIHGDEEEIIETQIDESTILNLETYEDIEAFSTEYQTLNNPTSIEEYTKKNDKHLRQIAKYNPELFHSIQQYHHVFLVFFDHIHIFDGCRIHKERRREEKLKFLEKR